jgi:hypothetical protein
MDGFSRIARMKTDPPLLRYFLSLKRGKIKVLHPFLRKFDDCNDEKFTWADFM